MISKTKFNLDNSQVCAVFNAAGFSDIKSIAPLTAGEFNSAYFVNADGHDYVLKVAPKNSDNTLTYEHNLMAQEIAFYKLIESIEGVRTPKIYYYDNSKKIIPTDFFIMEKLNSKPLTELKLSKTEKVEVFKKIGENIASLHTINGNKFGYEQNGLFDNWYDAIKDMTKNLIADCQKVGKTAKNGHKLLDFIDEYKEILLNVKSTYTHFDIWDGNIFYQKAEGKIELTFIDTERSFFGDCLGDFVSIDMFKSLQNKKEVLCGYNFKAQTPIVLTDEILIRYNILVAYLALIVFAEKFYRYKKFQSKYFVNIVLSKLLFNKAFKILKQKANK
ncbi:MAG: aminoglycoside phosphotransferase family protein [Clostridia bacterium]